MEKDSGVSLEFPTFFSEKSQSNFKFFFRKKSSLIQNISFKNFVDCFVKIGKFSLKPMLAEINNTSDFIIKLVSKKNTNIFIGVFFFLKLQKTIKFRKFLDFEYYSSMNSYYLKYKQKKLKQEKRGGNNALFPVDLIPPFFYKNVQKKNAFSFSVYSFFKKTQSNFFLKKNFEKTTIQILSMDKRSLVKKKNSEYFFINFQSDLIPNFSLEKIKKKLMFVPLFGIGFVSKLFKKRPIWNRKTLENFLPLSIKKYLKKILPTIGYRFLGVNPFKKSWIRLGFDPRKIKKSIIYQTLLIKLNSIIKNKNFFIKKTGKKLKFKKKLTQKKENFFNHTSNIFNKKFLRVSKNNLPQICDFHSEQCKKFFENNPKKKIFINYLIGWLSLNDFKKLNFLIKL